MPPADQWESLGEDVKYQVRELAKAGKLHPDPEVAEISVEFAYRARRDRRPGRSAGATFAGVVLTSIFGDAGGDPLVRLVDARTARRIRKIVARPD